MATPTFSLPYVKYLMRRADVYEFDLGDVPNEVTSSIHEAHNALNSPNYQFGTLETRLLNNTFLFNPTSFADKLYVRHINRRLRSKFHVKHPNRALIADQICTLLESDVSLNLFRSDIKSFFKSVDFDWLVARVEEEGLLSARDFGVFCNIRDQTHSIQRQGLPWGLSLSSTLAEVYLRRFDVHCRRIKGVTYYARFVDDIFLCAATNPSKIKQEIEFGLAGLYDGRLLLNPQKTELIDEASINFPTQTNFEFLGYAFSRTRVKAKEVETGISMATAKFQRMKRRIDAIFKRFYSDLNFFDLLARCRLLTTNYKIQKPWHQDPINTGIYYSYRSMTDYGQLDELDSYLRAKIMILRRRVARGKYHHIDQKRVRKLFKYSFREGFEKKLMHGVSLDRIRELQVVWRYV